MKDILLRIYRRIHRYFFPENYQSFALDALDVKMIPFLRKRNGFFIEAGANDGITQSNTLLFEMSFGWKGLLIEPIPELAERCRQNRPNCIIENCALVPFEYQNKEIEMRYSNLMSLVKGAMPSTEEELAHISKGCEIQNVETYEVDVPVSTLTAILDKYNIKKIDLLSLDVEGYELSVLKGIDFTRHRPKFILIEARFKEDIELYLKDLYIPVEKIGYYDILFKLKKSKRF